MVLKKILEYYQIPADNLLYKNLTLIKTGKHGETHLIEKEKDHENRLNTHLKTHGNTPPKEEKGNLNSNLKGNLNYDIGRFSSVVNEPAAHYDTDRYNVYDLDSLAAAGIALFIADEDKRKTAPTLRLPWLGPGLHIRLGVTGDSMHPTIKDGDKTISTWVDDISNLREGWVHIVLDKEEGLACKRVYRHHTKNTLQFISDNDVYKPYTRHFNDIIAIFRISEVTTTDLRPAMSQIEKEMRILQADMRELRSFMGIK